jgi:structural toxin protein (hemagglutinin/hemolysin) RtxA
MYHVAFYVPETHVEEVKESMFQAGAGHIGNYAKCSFEYAGIGQFQALPGSTPFVGKEGQVEKVKELKVEMVCKKELINAVVAALKASHPYETPAYYVTETVGV